MMLRKIIGAAVGAKLLKNSPAVGGAAGVALGTAVPFVMARLSLPTMVLLGVGGYAAKRWIDQQPKDTAPRSAPTYPAPVPTYD